MSLEVVAVSGLALVQDHGRPGYAHLGVPRSGVLDRGAAGLANRLVGNPDGRALLEVVGTVTLRPEADVWIAVVGAGAAGRAERCRAGVAVTLGLGLRSYVAVAGGIDVEPVLGSRSTDTLAWVGPPPLATGMRLPTGAPVGTPAAADVVGPRRSGEIRVLPGPASHRDLVLDAADLFGRDWVVGAASNRVGVRLHGALVRREPGELPSEGTVLGAIQVPPSGEPIVLLNDHGPTGGYPVAGVVHPDDLWQWAYAAPGDVVRLSPH